MEYYVIRVETQTASFRVPEFQNFHKSYYLPPPTTVMGMAGAAMGLSPKDTQAFFDAEAFEMGIYGISQGKAKDLWKYRTMKTSTSRSILRREILFLNSFCFAFGAKDARLVDKLRHSFMYPVYALTLGSSDSLAKVTLVDDFELSESSEVESCILAGNVISEVFANSENGLEFSLYTSREPITYEVPVRFEYESDYGVRRVIKRKEFSFIGKGMKLNIQKKGIRAGNVFVPLFSLSG